MFSCQLTKQRNQRSVIIPALLLFITISTDLYTKYLAGRLIGKDHEFNYLHNFFKFSLVKNHGGFLGIVNNLPENIRFFLLNICVFFVLFGYLLYFFRLKKETIHYDFPLILVAGGGIGNLLDRLLHHGGVTDFLSIGLGSFRTGIFNLADIYILIGSFIFGFFLFSSPAEST